MPHTLIVGAGISGLTCAYELSRQGVDVLVIESSARAGGEIHSESVDGYLIEYGPNSLRGKIPELTDLIHSLGLTDRIIRSSTVANQRYILRNGKPVLLPTGPAGIFSTTILSGNAKLRALREPFVSGKPAKDESVRAFFERRFGKEIVDYLVAPYLTGIFAGDVNALSAKHAFPGLWESEQRYGSILRGALRSRKKKAVATEPTQSIKGIFSFDDGLNAVPNALRSALEGKTNFSTPVESIAKQGASYEVGVADATVLTDRLILATPADVTAQLVRGLVPDAASALQSIVYAPVVVIHLGFRIEQFSTQPTGFGMLVPPIEAKNYLGAIFTSSIFPKRAPEGHTLITMLLGGATHPELILESDERLFELAIKELREALPFIGEPDFQRIIRWSKAIPQYNVGYDSVLETLNSAETQNPGLHFLGSYRGGIAIGECVRSATQLARSLV